MPHWQLFNDCLSNYGAGTCEMAAVLRSGAVAEVDNYCSEILQDAPTCGLVIKVSFRKSSYFWSNFWRNSEIFCFHPHFLKVVNSFHICEDIWEVINNIDIEAMLTDVLSLFINTNREKVVSDVGNIANNPCNVSNYLSVSQDVCEAIGLPSNICEVLDSNMADTAICYEFPKVGSESRQNFPEQKLPRKMKSSIVIIECVCYIFWQ